MTGISYLGVELSARPTRPALPCGSRLRSLRDVLLRPRWALRTSLDSWPGIGHVAVGMHRQGFDLQLTQYDERVWRAMFLHDWHGRSTRRQVKIRRSYRLTGISTHCSP